MIYFLTNGIGDLRNTKTAYNMGIYKSWADGRSIGGNSLLYCPTTGASMRGRF